MSTIFDPADLRALDARIARLTPDLKPRWGKMNAPQMVGHLIEAGRMATGELAVRARPSFLSNPIVRWLVICVFPFPKGAPTGPELLARAPSEWGGEVETLRAQLARVSALSLTAPWAAHPAFGAIGGTLYGRLIYKHVSHHLTQFGV